MKNNILKRYIQLTLVLIILSGITFSALSYSSGISGQTQNGCSCHGSSNSATTVTFASQSGNFTVNPGQTANFSVTISNGSQSAAGVDIAVKTSQTGETNAGSLTAGSGLQVSNGELTHTSAMNLSGGQATFNFSWTAPSTPGIYYLRAAGNAVNSNGGSSGDIWNKATVQTITVPGIELTSLNGGQALCPGGQTNITWTAVGVTNVKIELSTNGGSSFETILNNSVDASLGSWTWNIPSDFNAGTQYKIKISNTSDANLNDISNSNFTVGESVQITTQPQSQQKCTGQSVSFTVTASGTNLTYQWRKNSVNINGATQSSYTINSLAMPHAGNYDVIVSGSCGNPITSSQATLSLNESPSISTHPESQQKCPGESVTFNVVASGTDIAYQWLKNGSPINGETNSSYTIFSVSSSDGGKYSVTINGICTPSVTSSEANLTVNSPVEITSITNNTTKCEGETLQLVVQAIGSNLIYLWKKDDVIVEGQNTATLTVENLKKTDEGIYTVTINGDCQSSATSNPVNVVVNTKPIIVLQPNDLNSTVEDEIVFKVSSNNTASSYQWRKNGVNINQAKDSILIINSVSQADSGNYDCVLTNSCGNSTSNIAKLTVQAKKSGPSIKLSVNSLDFGIVNVGKSKTILLEGFLENNGDEVLNIESINIIGTGSQYFNVKTPITQQNIAVGEKINFEIDFNPAKSGDITANLEFISNAVNKQSIVLSGFGGIVNIQFSENQLDFGDITFGETKQKELFIKNKGNFLINISQIELTGKNSTDFKMADGTNPSLINSEDSVNVKIIYSPTVPGSSEANLIIKLDLDSTFIINLQGSSKIVSVDEKTLSILNSISPNPTFSELKVSLNIDTPDLYMVSIYDITGNLVKILQNSLLSKGENNILWDLSDSNGNLCSSGKYNLIIQSKRYYKSYSFIINK